MQSASKLYKDIIEALKHIEESENRVAEKIIINRKDYIAMLIDTMAAPIVKANITQEIQKVAMEVAEKSTAFTIIECWAMKTLLNEVVIDLVVVKKFESEQLDLFKI